jgi:murein DD-endopeptidase MepM/ murein hydrolase activator NlpD
VRLRGFACTVCLVLLGALALPQAATSSNAGTAALQVALRARGLYRDTIDGIRGPKTISALIIFQRRSGLAADGVPGPLTRRALGPYGRHLLGSRLLTRGTSGWDVAALQFRLAWAGFPSGVFDGRFRGHLDRALRAFQRFAGLAPDGIAGPAVLAALRRPPPRSPVELAWPLRAPVGDRFGPRANRFHAGIDLPAPARTPVAAPGSGRVTYSGPASTFGILVVIDHGDGVETFSAHLSRALVRVGQPVRLGQVVGEVGASGEATGPHLHFEVHVRGAAIDPLGALN